MTETYEMGELLRLDDDNNGQELHCESTQSRLPCVAHTLQLAI
jgi:hypothetical protein